MTLIKSSAMPFSALYKQEIVRLAETIHEDLDGVGRVPGQLERILALSHAQILKRIGSIVQLCISEQSSVFRVNKRCASTEHSTVAPANTEAVSIISQRGRHIVACEGISRALVRGKRYEGLRLRNTLSS